MRHELGRDEARLPHGHGHHWCGVSQLWDPHGSFNESEGDQRLYPSKVQVDVNGEDDGLAVPLRERGRTITPTEVRALRRRGDLIGSYPATAVGRSYVYQAMRASPAPTPATPIRQRPCGQVAAAQDRDDAAHGLLELWQPDRPCGSGQRAVPSWLCGKAHGNRRRGGATPADHVRRETPIAGDRSSCSAGRTGRDGIGRTTAPPRPTTYRASSLRCRGAKDVPVERKLQRLFRRRRLSRLIKRCNDFWRWRRRG